MNTLSINPKQQAYVNTKLKEIYELTEKLQAEENHLLPESGYRRMALKKMFKDAHMKKVSECGKLTLALEAEVLREVVPIIRVNAYTKASVSDEVVACSTNEEIESIHKHKPLSETFYMYNDGENAFVELDDEKNRDLLLDLLPKLSFITKSASGFKLFELARSQIRREFNKDCVEYTLPAVQHPLKVDTSTKKWDYKLPVPNGVFDCATMSFQPHDKDRLVFNDEKYLDVVPNADKKYDQLFDSYYLSIANADHTRALRLKQIHMAAILGLSLKKAIFLYGDAGTGKSTYLSITEKLAKLDKSKSGASHAKLSDFDKDDALVLLSKSSAVINYDSSDKFILKDSALENFKKAIMGEPLTASQKYKERLDFVFNGLVLQATNSIPRFEFDTSFQPILDRVNLVMLTHKFRNESSDVKDYDRLLTDDEHLPYLVGYLFRSVNPFTQLVAHEDDKQFKQSLSESDSVKAYVDFLVENQLQLSKKVPIGLLKVGYIAFMKQHMGTSRPVGARILQQRLIKYLKELGYIYADIPHAAKMNTLLAKGHLVMETFNSISQRKDFLADLDYYLSDNRLVRCFVSENDTPEQEEQQEQLTTEQELMIIASLMTNEVQPQYVGEYLALKESFNIDETNQSIIEQIHQLYLKLKE